MESNTLESIEKHGNERNIAREIKQYLESDAEVGSAKWMAYDDQVTLKVDEESIRLHEKRVKEGWNFDHPDTRDMPILYDRAMKSVPLIRETIRQRSNQIPGYTGAIHDVLVLHRRFAQAIETDRKFDLETARFSATHQMRDVGIAHKQQ